MHDNYHEDDDDDNDKDDDDDNDNDNDDDTFMMIFKVDLMEGLQLDRDP